MVLTCMYVYAEAYLEPSPASPVEHLWLNSFGKITRKLCCRCSTGFQYASGIGFTVGKVYRMSIFI